jgi:protein-S-isoprenylcysteine O-methyltransferase Ste14
MAQNMTNPSNSIIEQLSRQASSFTNTSLNLPQHLEGALTRLEQGDLKMRVNSVEANRELRQLNALVRSLIYVILFSTFFLSATQFVLAGWLRAAACLFGIALLALLVLMRQLLAQQKYPV